MSIIFKMPKELPKEGVAIVKLYLGEQFYIAKTSNIEWIVKELQKTYGKYLRGGIPEENLYYPLIRLLYKAEKPKVVVDIVFCSTNGYSVLKYELEQLQMHFGKPYCLNRNNIPHIPKTVVAKKGSSWLTQNQALNFRKLLTKYDY